jgi:hypothetical protein
VSNAAQAALDIIAERKAKKTRTIPMDMCYQLVELSAQEAATDQNIRRVVESFGFEIRVEVEP